MLVLEELEHALDRGADILAEVSPVPAGRVSMSHRHVFFSLFFALSVVEVSIVSLRRLETVGGRGRERNDAQESYPEREEMPMLSPVSYVKATVVPVITKWPLDFFKLGLSL